MAVVELKENDEWKEFIKAEYSVIDCYGENCVACVILALGRVNISFLPGVADEYGIDAMPTLLYFRKGKLVNQSIGSIEREELLANISKMLYED